MGEETVVKVKETAVPGLVAAVLSVTVLVAVDKPTVTATTVVPEAIPVPDTVLPTTIEEADDTDSTVVLPEVKVPVEVDTELMPVPVTVLPTTIDEAEVTDVTVVLPEIRVPVEVVTTPEVV